MGGTTKGDYSTKSLNWQTVPPGPPDSLLTAEQSYGKIQTTKEERLSQFSGIITVQVQ